MSYFRTLKNTHENIFTGKKTQKDPAMEVCFNSVKSRVKSWYGEQKC